MKNAIIFLFISLNFTFFTQLEYVNSLEEAFKRANESNKLVFIKCYSANCSHCKKLQEVLEIDSVSNFLSNNFISYKIEAGNAPESDFEFINSNKIFFENVPIMLFFDKNRNFVHYGQPKQEVELVYKALKTALVPFERTSNLKNRYESGERDNILIKRYSKLAQLNNNTQLVNTLALEIYNQFPKEELLTIKSITSCSNYVKSIFNPFFEFWMDNYDKLEQVSPENTLENKQKIFTTILSENLSTQKEKWDLEQIKKAKNYIEITKFHRNPNVFLWLEESNLLIKAKNELEIIKIIESLIETENNNPHLLVYCVETLAQNMMDKSALKKLGEITSNIVKNDTYESEIKSKLLASKALIDKKSK
jgi:hypothetical protein